MKERRKYVRLNEAVKIDYKVVNQKATSRGSASENIGGGGVRLPVAEKLDAGATLELKIYLPESSQPITATAEVLWCTSHSDKTYPFVAGVQFINIDPFDRGRILTFIRKRVTGG